VVADDVESREFTTMRTVRWMIGRTVRPGMVMMASRWRRRSTPRGRTRGAQVIALRAGGRPLTDTMVRRWAERGGSLALVCGRYEGSTSAPRYCVEEVVSVVTS